MLDTAENIELKLQRMTISDGPRCTPPNIQDDVEVTITTDSPPNVQDDVKENITKNRESKLRNRIQDQPPNIQDSVDSNDGIIKRPAGCYIIR